MFNIVLVCNIFFYRMGEGKKKDNEENTRDEQKN